MTVSGTPGTGTITLGSAESGYQSFATAYGADATVDVVITDGTAWEVARGCAYTHSGTTLSRGTLEDSSTGSAISLTSAAVVSVTHTAGVAQMLERAMQGVMPGGRLTLESGVPVSTSDQTAKTSIYYTPYVHDTIPLWNGVRWEPTTFTETTLALGTLTSGKPYDVFAYLSGGALSLESLAWTDDSTRATAVTLQDGRYCKSGDKTRLLVGTFYTTSTTTTEDSDTKRYLANVYNRVTRKMEIAESTVHAYTTGTWRKWNNGSSSDIFFVLPLAATVNLQSNVVLDGIGNAGAALNSDSSPLHYGNSRVSTTTFQAVNAAGARDLAAGRHTAYAMEFGGTSGNFRSCRVVVGLNI